MQQVGMFDPLAGKLRKLNARCYSTWPSYFGNARNRIGSTEICFYGLLTTYLDFKAVKQTELAVFILKIFTTF